MRLEEYVEDYPTGVPKDLIALFKEVARESDAIIKGSDDTNELNLIFRALTWLASYSMSLLDHANSAQTPRGLARFLSQIRDGLQKDSELLVTPLADYNYTIGNHFPYLDKALRGTLISEASWDAKSAKYKNGLNVVRFPRIERDNVLLHAIFGHEFGHPIADAFLAEDQKSTDYQTTILSLKEKINEAYSSHLSGESDPVKRIKRHGKLCDIAAELRRRGLEELISDAVAAMLFGPSALFAAAELLVPDGLDQLPQPQEYYPPSRFRLRVICKVLKNSGHLEALKGMAVDPDLADQLTATKEYLAHLESLAHSSDDIAERNKNPLVRIAYEWIDKSLDAGIAYAASAVDAMSYKSTTVMNQTPEALRRLDLGIPPSEFGIFPKISPIDWRTAILAGWMHKLHVLALPNVDWLNRRDRIKDTQTLTLKGIEDSLLSLEYVAQYPDALNIESTSK